MNSEVLNSRSIQAISRAFTPKQSMRNLAPITMRLSETCATESKSGSRSRRRSVKKTERALRTPVLSSLFLLWRGFDYIVDYEPAN